jgi:hypothetical protein
LLAHRLPDRPLGFRLNPCASSSSAAPVALSLIAEKIRARPAKGIKPPTRREVTERTGKKFLRTGKEGKESRKKATLVLDNETKRKIANEHFQSI